jgi:hypothetical protein
MTRRTRKRIETLESICASLELELARLRSEQANVLFGFAGDIDELKLSLDGFDELAEAQRTAYTEQLKKDIGFQSMMNY